MQVIKAFTAGEDLHLTVDPYNPDYDYAFYVYANGVRVQASNYSPNPSIIVLGRDGTSFEIEGFYRRRIDGERRKLDRSYLWRSGDNVPHSGADSRIDLDATDRQRGTITADGITFEVIFQRKKVGPLFVLLSAAINRKKMWPPVFNRWTWLERFPGSVICIADPSLDLDGSYELGWYVGKRGWNVTEALVRLVSQLATRLCIDARDVIFYGSSGGGFASLMCSAKLSGSRAVAINAQTKICDYEIRRSVAKFIDIAFSGESEEAVRERYRDRVSAVHLFATMRPGKVILIQNLLDRHHYLNHFIPMCAVLGMEETGGEGVTHAPGAVSIVYSHSSGHGGEPPELIEQIINFAIAS